MRRPLPQLLAVPLIALVALAGCGSSDSDGAADDQTTSTVATTIADTTTTTEAPTTTTEAPAADETTTAPSPATTQPDPEEGSSPLEGFEEYAVLQDTIPELDTLTPDVETDNPNTRVILYSNAEGRKVYKSVFIKAKSRLKVLNLGEGPPLYDAPI